MIVFDVAMGALVVAADFLALFVVLSVELLSQSVATEFDAGDVHLRVNRSLGSAVEHREDH